MNFDVVLCVPSCEGPVRKAFDVTGVTPAVAVTAVGAPGAVGGAGSSRTMAATDGTPAPLTMNIM